MKNFVNFALMLKIKRKLYILLFFTLVSLSASAQYKWDFGASIGAGNYVGEIGGYDTDARPSIADMRFVVTRPSFGIYGRKKLHKLLGIKLGLNWIRIAGVDSITVSPGRSGRNLSFRNDIWELALTPEFYFFQLPDFARIGRRGRVDFRAYAYAGAAVFLNNPKARYPYSDPNAPWYALRNLRTEGQATPYPLINASIPVGLGMDYTFNRRQRLALEVGFRRTFTDYLDDVSTNYADSSAIGSDLGIKLANRRPEVGSVRAESVAVPQQYYPGEKRGNPVTKDYYLLANVNYSFVIKGKSSFYKSKYNYLTGAKRKFKRKRVRAKF